MEAVRTKKKKAGRRPKAVKREIRAAIRFTKSEYFIVKEKAATCGKRPADYIRQLAINAEIKTRLTNEERQFLKDLIAIGNNINQIAKACHDEGVLKAMMYFKNYVIQMDELIKKLKS